VKQSPHNLVGDLVGIDERLIGRPLPLELIERGCVDHGAPRLKLMDMDVHHAHVSLLPAAQPGIT
jgi:hypothetical protein